jgi:hypothetical protein
MAKSLKPCDQSTFHHATTVIDAAIGLAGGMVVAHLRAPHARHEFVEGLG